MDYYNLDQKETFLISLKAFIVRNGKILVMRFPETDKQEWAGRWGLPGGLLEMNESLEKGLIREVKEETSLEISIGQPILVGEFMYKGFILKDGRELNARIIEIGFLCQYKAGRVKLSEEHDRYLWTTLEELKKLEYSPGSKKLIEDYLSLRKPS